MIEDLPEKMTFFNDDYFYPFSDKLKLDTLEKLEKKLEYLAHCLTLREFMLSLFIFPGFFFANQLLKSFGEYYAKSLRYLIVDSNKG